MTSWTCVASTLGELTLRATLPRRGRQTRAARGPLPCTCYGLTLQDRGVESRSEGHRIRVTNA
jgi:hypothetical protein